MSKGFASSYRIVLLAGGLFLCFGAIGVRLVWLHVIDRDELLATISRMRHQLIVETARRGDIYDANGTTLATSRSLIVLGVDPAVLRPQDEAKWPQLAAMIAVPLPELRRIFTTKYRPAPDFGSRVPDFGSRVPDVGSRVSGFGSRGGDPAASGDPALQVVLNVKREGGPDVPRPADAPVAGAEADESADDAELESPDEKGRRPIRWAKLAENITESTYRQIEALGIRGVYGQRVYRRTYPNNQLAAHLVGFVNTEQRGRTGVERYADFYLRGQNGWRVGEKDGRGRELPQYTTRQVPPSDGYNVTLTINAAVQDIVEQELAYLGQRFQPLKATIVVSRPRTGEILALGNYPTFDLNQFARLPKEEWRRMTNVAVAEIYEPGSVFKIVAAAGALEEGLAHPTEVFDCSLEKFTHRGRALKLPGEDHHMGELTLAEIMSRSSNRGAAQLGMRLGEERLYRYARGFGFGEPLGFPVGGEVGGILLPPKKWNPIDITRIPMGHTVAATVLQMHQAMATIANDGVLLRPQIIREIRDQAGEQVFAYGPVEVGRVVSPQTAQTVAAMLLGVTTKGGTALEAAIPGFEVAGKTGTTQKIIDGVYSRKHHVASFVGFFPASNPQVAISVIVDDADAHAPGGVAYGRNVAAPSFRNIGEKLIPILGIKAPGPLRPNLVAANEGGRR